MSLLKQKNILITNKFKLMRTTGIVFVVLGSLGTLGQLVAAAQGHNATFGPIAFVVLGAFLITMANRKKAEEEKKRKWAEGKTDKNE